MGVGRDVGRGKDGRREEVGRMASGREREGWREGVGMMERGREGEGVYREEGEERWMKGVQI